MRGRLRAGKIQGTHGLDVDLSALHLLEAQRYLSSFRSFESERIGRLERGYLVSLTLPLGHDLPEPQPQGVSQLRRHPVSRSAAGIPEEDMRSLAHPDPPRAGRPHLGEVGPVFGL